MSEGTKKVIMSVVAVVLLGAAIYTVSGFFGEEDYVKKANTRTLMDSETGKLYEFEFHDGWGQYPHKNPDTGTETLFPIEWCFNRECGDNGGTAVILNTWFNKEGPTYCPKCGSLVVFHNPRPKQAKDVYDPSSGLPPR